MADIRLAKPAAGASESVQCAPDARFVFDFPTTDATLAREGDNLNIRFEDGSNLQLEGFYQQYNEENLPSFNIDGTEVAAADFFAAMNEPDLMPAAGPGTGTVANGARFHEWGDSALTGGIQHLDGLDWGFSRSFEWDDVPNAVGRSGDDWGWWGNRGGAADNPVTIVPEDPTPVPPGTPNIPGIPVGGEPGNEGIVPPGDVRVVDEAGLRDGGTVSVNGAMRVTAPDGLASIEIAGHAIWQNGHMVGNPQFATDEGYFHNFAYDAATGRLTYTYTLTSSTQEHGQPGADHIAHSLPVTVRDTDGDSASSSVTIVIRDDTAQAANDSDAAVEGHEVTGNVLVNDTHGADGAGTFAGGRTVRWDVPEGTAEGTDDAGNHYLELALKDADGKLYGTVKLYDDGTYVLKAETIGDWDEGEWKFSAPAIDYTIVDADGDLAHATLDLEVLKSVPGITPNKPGPGDGSSEPDADGNGIVVDEGALPDGTGAHNAHGVSGTGSVTIDVNGETGTVNFGGIKFTLSGKAEISLGNQTITEPATGVTVTLEKAVFNEETQKWDVSYTYSFDKAQRHTDAEKSGADDVLSGDITITVTDESGDTASGKLSLEVHDDAPVVTANDVTNTINVQMGADTDGKSESIVVSFAGEKGDAKQSWKPNEGENAGRDEGEDIKDFTPGEYVNEAGTVIMTVDGQGNYSFKLVRDEAGKPESEENIEVKLVATDSDGDHQGRNITLTVPGITPNTPQPGDGSSEPDAGGNGILVDEGGLAGGTGAHNAHGVSGSGTVTIDVNGETGKVNFGGVEFELSGKGEISLGNQTITDPATGVTVTLEKAVFDEATQKWDVSYRYSFDKAQTHDKTEDHAEKSGAEDILSGSITITVTDESGDTASGSLTIEVHDDAPVVKANDVTDTIHVQMGSDADGKSESIVVSFAGQDAEGAPTDIPQGWKPNGDESADEYSKDINGFTAGEYVNEAGTVIMTVDGQGNYSFKLVRDEAGKPESEENIEVKLVATDSDGDHQGGNITLTVPGITPNKPQPGDGSSEPDADGNGIVVDEGGLAGGTGAHNAHGVSGSGTVTIDVNGETGKVNFGGVEFELSGKGEMSLGNQTITDPATGVTVTLEKAVFDEATQKWDVSYTYSFDKAQTHANAEKSGADDVLSGDITITVTDESSDTASGKLSIEVHDDAPVISEVLAVGGKPINAVEFSFGADDRAGDESSLQQVEVRIDGNKLTWADGEDHETSDLSQIKSGEWTTTATAKDVDGNEVKVDLKVSYQDGKYVFAYADKEAANPDLKLDVQITDADGDTASATVSLATPGLEVPPPPTPGGTPFIPATGKAQIVVDEGALLENAQGHAYHGKDGRGSFEVELSDTEGGIIELEADGQKVTLTIAADGKPTCEPENASFTINGVKVGGFTASPLGDGKWEVSYDYALTAAQTHDKNVSDDVIFTDQAIRITVMSGGSKSDQGGISVEVHDDIPVISAVPADAEGPVNSVEFSFGADNRPNLNTSQQQVTVSVDGQQLTWRDGEGAETSDLSRIGSGEWTAEAPLEGQVDEDGNQLTTTVKITYQNGKYVFDYADKDGENPDLKLPDLKLDVQITDADGDTASASVYLGTQPGDDPGTPGNESNIPVADNANIVVDEGALKGGSHIHDAHGKEGIGHFDVELPHAEGGSIVLTVPDADGNPVTVTINIAAASVEGEPAHTIDGASLEANGVELSEFQLVYNGEKAGAEGKDSWTVNYHYELTGAQKHGTDDTDQSLYKEGAVHITVTDGTGDVVAGQINIEVHDDVPLAVDDSNEVIRDHKPIVTGDLLENDSFGADDRYATVEAGQAAAVFVRPDTTAYPAATANEDGSYTIQGKYGTLTLNADGTYSYKLDDKNEDVLNLGKNDHLRDETFDYQIIDGDGDVSTATLTINVAGDHGVTVTPGDNPTPGASSVATVYDAGLAGGNHEGQPHYATEVSKTLHIEAKDGLASIKVDGELVWDKADGFRENVELPAADGTLKITGYDADSGTLSYTYTLTSAAEHGKPGSTTDDRLSHEFTVEVRDTDGDVGEGTITINVVDDAPVFTSSSYEVTSEPDFTSLAGINNESMFIDFANGKAGKVGSYASVFEDRGLKTTLEWNGSSGTPGTLPTVTRDNPTVQAQTTHGSVTMTGTFVHYRYVENAEAGELHVDNVVDITNAIQNSAKALRLTDKGITVGATTTNAWNGGKNDGEITAGGIYKGSHNLTDGKPGTKNFENAYGTGHYLGTDENAKQIDGDNVSEAIVFDLGKITSYGFRINLNGLDKGDRALLTFMQTPANSSDDSIVKMVEITGGVDESPFFTKDANGNYTISVPDGFTKVFVSALPKENYTVSEGGFKAETSEARQSSGFIIKSVDFLKATEVSSGKVEAISADNADLTYDWNWDDLKCAEVLLKGENDPRTLDTPALVAEESNATFKTYLCKVDGVDLFKATINTATGEWTVTHYREFEMSKGENPFRIDAKDSDDDVSTIDLELNPQFTRFAEVIDGTYLDGWKQQDVATKDQADDILVGKDDNSLMYGKGGDDLLIGDRLEGAPAEFDAAGKTVENLAARIANAATDATEKNLNDVAGDVTGDKITIYPDTKVDTLYKDINALTNAQKDLLGQELEGYEKIGNGDDALYGGQGNDLLFGAGGNDYLSGDLGSDIIYGGGGHDIILYDEKDAYIDGGSGIKGIDILLAGKSADLHALQNQDNIRNIEVFIRSENTDNIASLGITSLKTLAQYGVSIDEDNNTIQLSGAWTYEGNGVYKNGSAGLQLATNLSNIGVVDIREANKKTGTAANDVLLDSAAAGIIGASLQNSYFDDVFKHHEELAREIAKADTKEGASNIFAGGGDDILFSNAQYGFLLGDGDEETKEAIDGDVFHRNPAEQTIGEYIGTLKGSVERLEEIDSSLQGKETDLEKDTDGADILHGGAGSEILYGGGKSDHLDGGAGDDILIGGAGDDLLLGGAGDDILIGGSGNDFLDGGADKDSLFGGSGDDLIIYDPTDYLIDGGEGIDFLLSSGQNGQEYTLKEMMDNYTDKANADADMPRVNGVEVMIRGVDTTGLQSMDDLARECGFTFEDGKLTLGAQWKQVDGSANGTTTTYVNTENDITLETTLAELKPGGDEAGEQAAQTIVLTNNG